MNTAGFCHDLIYHMYCMMEKNLDEHREDRDSSWWNGYFDARDEIIVFIKEYMGIGEEDLKDVSGRIH